MSSKDCYIFLHSNVCSRSFGVHDPMMIKQDIHIGAHSPTLRGNRIYGSPDSLAAELLLPTFTCSLCTHYPQWVCWASLAGHADTFDTVCPPSATCSASIFTTICDSESLVSVLLGCMEMSGHRVRVHPPHSRKTEEGIARLDAQHNRLLRDDKIELFI
jgi:hypothetical protein